MKAKMKAASFDRKFDALGVTRQSLIKLWLADRLAQH